MPAVSCLMTVYTNFKTPSARVTGAVSYRASSGRKLNIPIGPCLIERDNGPSVNIIWGEHGQCRALMTIEDLEAAQDQGHFVELPC